MTIKFSTVLGIFGSPSDRFVSSGYRPPVPLEKMFEDTKKVEDLTGIELVGTWHINENNVDEIKKYIKKYDLKVSMIIPDIFAQARWGNGTFTSNDPKIRKDAINEVKKYMDIAPELGCDLLDLWFGQDGYDYSFQMDYIKSWNLLIDGIKECANYRKDVRLGLEYKIKEPRTHCIVATVGKTLLLLREINMDNVGLVLDVGHGFVAYENVAESIALAKMFGNKLFQLHLNDNYRLWDDDMMVSSVHVIEYLELLYWLKKTGYNGWYSLDIYPYRENGVEAANESIGWLKSMMKALENTKDSEIEQVLSEGNATRSMNLVRTMLLKY
jgi:xylose isomerase